MSYHIDCGIPYHSKQFRCPLSPSSNNSGISKEELDRALADLYGKLDDKAPAFHTHKKDEIVGLQEAIDSIDLSIGEPGFKSNMECGGIAAGSQIDASTPLATIVRNMLLKKKFATIKATPSATLTNTGTASGDYEVGTTIAPILSVAFSDGSFNSYKDSNSVETISAGCSKSSVTYKKSGSDYDEKPFALDKGTTSLTATIEYTASSNVPKDSDMSDSNTHIQSGSCQSNAIRYIGKYGYFFNTFETAPDKYTRDVLGAPFLIDDGTKTHTLWFNNKVVVLAVPKGHKLISAISTANENQAYSSKIIEMQDAGGNSVAYTLYVFTYSAAGGLGLNVNCVF